MQGVSRLESHTSGWVKHISQHICLHKGIGSVTGGGARAGHRSPIKMAVPKRWCASYAAHAYLTADGPKPGNIKISK